MGGAENAMSSIVKKLPLAGGEPIHPRISVAHPLNLGRRINLRSARLTELELHLEEDSRILWCNMLHQTKPSFTHALLTEMGLVYSEIKQTFGERRKNDPTLFDYFVFGSKTPGIYNFGGDLAHFVDLVRAGDLESMRHYAHVCIERQLENANAFHAPVITMALVRGDALGGGFEHALSHDVIVAERSAKLGLPEVLFNLFPGMGAYSFISRRLNRRAAEQLIMSGQVYSGEELHELGIIDVLAEDGEGENALREYVEQHKRKFNMRRAVYEARRRVNPVTREELLSITDLWAETAMDLGERDLRVMERLYAAQDRRVAGDRSKMKVVGDR